MDVVQRPDPREPASQRALADRPALATPSGMRLGPEGSASRRLWLGPAAAGRSGRRRAMPSCPTPAVNTEASFEPAVMEEKDRVQAGRSGRLARDGRRSLGGLRGPPDPVVVPVWWR